MEKFNLGDRVKVLSKNEKGRIAFIGKTNFSDGTWVGVNLDTAVGKNNGTVADTFYFKCPTSHGIFVKANHLEKVNEDNDRDQHYGTVPDQITSRNDYITDAKCNTDSYQCTPKSLEIPTAKSRIQFCQNDPNPQSLETANVKSQLQITKKESCLCEAKRVGSLKAKSRIKVYQSNPKPPCLPDLIFKSQLQIIKKENRQLRNELETTEDALLVVRGKYNEVIEENRLLKNDIGCKKKQIEIQKLHLKLLRMQCKSLQKTDFFHTTSERTNQREEDRASDGQLDIINHDSNDSDSEFSLQAIKAMTSMKRIVDLEAENRIMFEGLVGLRNWLKSEGPRQFQNIKPSRKRSRHQLQKTKPVANSVPESHDSSAMIKEEASAIVKYTPQKKGGEIRKKSSEIRNRSGGFRKEYKTKITSVKGPKSVNSSNKQLVVFDKHFELSRCPPNQHSSARNTKSVLGISEIRADSLKILPARKNTSLNNYQAPPHFPKLVTVTSTKQGKLSKPDLVNELTALMNAVSFQSGGFCQSTASLIQKQYRVKEISDHESVSETLEAQPNSNVALSVHAKEIADTSNDDCAKILPKT